MQNDFAGCIGRPISFHVDEYGHDRAIEMPSSPLASVAMLAVWNVCGPIIERHIHENSFSSRKGLGQHAYAKKVSRFVHTHHQSSRATACTSTSRNTTRASSSRF